MTSTSDHRRRPVAPATRAVLVDVALTAATAAGICLAIAVFREPDARPPDALAYVFGVLIALPLLWRRRAPRAVLVANYVLLGAYYITGYPAVGLVLPLVVAIATVSSSGHARFAAGLLAFGVTISAGFRLMSEDETVLSVLDDTVRDAALGTAALLFGAAVRSRRALEEATRARLELLAAERERDADARVERERVRLARELHDELAHSVTVMGLHADVATEAITAAGEQEDPDLAPVRDAVLAIRGVARDTMRDLRRTLGALRGDPADDARAPAAGTAALAELLARADAAGLATTLDLELGDVTLSTTLDRTVHRLVQEAVTNTLRHAGARRVDVEVVVVGRDLAVAVTDDGSARPATTGGDEPIPGDGAGGHGLLGMRERVLLLGGAFDAGPREAGGFAVRARIPLDATAPHHGVAVGDATDRTGRSTP